MADILYPTSKEDRKAAKRQKLAKITAGLQDTGALASRLSKLSQERQADPMLENLMRPGSEQGIQQNPGQQIQQQATIPMPQPAPVQLPNQGESPFLRRYQTMMPKQYGGF